MSNPTLSHDALIQLVFALAVMANAGEIWSGPGNEYTNNIRSYCNNLQKDEDGTVFDRTDNPEVLSQNIESLRSKSVSTFAVLFDDQEAFSTLDPSLESIEQMLTSDPPPSGTTTWINVWHPAQQRDLIESIAKRFDFTPRLLALLSSRPLDSRLASHSSITSSRPGRKWFKRRQKPAKDTDNLEKGADHASELSAISSESNSQSNIYSLAQEIWHFTTMDFGRNYICLGYNTLCGIAPLQDELDDDDHLPSCTRVWNWLILCDNNVVISIQEDVFPFQHAALDPTQLHILAQVRQNVLTVFRSLSLVDSDPLSSDHPMTLLPIRARLGSTTEETIHRESNAPGLLFYYLFENWQNSYTLITRKESRYGIELKHLRKEMFNRPRLEHINRLHSIGQELGILKRHYDSYIRLIDRLLEPRPLTIASLQNSRVAEQDGTASLTDTRPLLEVKESSLGVPINTATRVRFKRLQDMIDLYALSEIDEYLSQKESLISLNFNLLTLRESLDVERLTRITLLLTKASFVFLPISLMTSYFSVQLSDTDYSITQFWVTFVIVLTLSWLAMFIFGVFSGGTETAAAVGTLQKWLKLTVLPRA